MSYFVSTVKQIICLIKPIRSWWLRRTRLINSIESTNNNYYKPYTIRADDSLAAVETIRFVCCHWCLTGCLTTGNATINIMTAMLEYDTAYMAGCWVSQADSVTDIDRQRLVFTSAESTVPDASLACRHATTCLSQLLSSAHRHTTPSCHRRYPAFLDTLGVKGKHTF